MTRLSKIQRLSLLAASTTVITGGVLFPVTAFAAPAPQTAPVATTDAATHWTATTDDLSGITAELPGHPQMQKYSENGVEARVYLVPTDYGTLGFVVYDTPNTGQKDLKGCLQSWLDGYNEDSRSGDSTLTSKDLQEGTTADGQPAVDSALSAGDGTVGHVRFVDLGDHMVQVVALGKKGSQQDVDADYLQLLNGVQLPSDGTTQSY
ncbi:hypothetical protein [Streptomyces diastatochromogenes]|uniref:Uncharacterized protein n=1 Tax=Streptomyces diastatochromogenes TaxID=42236 RepID=A0A233SLJ8_STRDA|nr:hypothetical protein [Streptomyces diastatochromogenes]MCZ0988834.1 hypothetical protein [Streptomyces diastatochromogenes]OXY96518.1 hypothetical protein BEK98_12595 [Streptomyces diastatochromogenes]